MAFRGASSADCVSLPSLPYQLPTAEQLERTMDLALEAAAEAKSLGEVPVGAVILSGDEVVATAHNLRETTRDPCAHAELLAIRQAAARLGRWRLSGCTLVVTLEPCPMCAGAIVNSRLDGLVYGAADPKAGAVGSLCNLVEDLRLNHRAQVVTGVKKDAARALLQSFFSDLRRKRRADQSL